MTMSEFSRPFIKCGIMHDTGLQNRETGLLEVRFDKCYDCFMEDAYTYVPITEQIVLRD